MSRTSATTAPPPDKAVAKNFLAQAEEFMAPHQSRFDVLLSVVAGEHGLAPVHVSGASKTRRVMSAKREAVALAVEFLCPPLNVETIGVFLNLGRATVYRLEAEAKKLAQSDAEFAARLEKLRVCVREAIERVSGPPSPQPSPPGEGENKTEDKSNG